MTEPSELSEVDRLKQVESATYDWSSFLSTPIGRVVGGLVVALLMYAASCITDRTKTTPPVPAPQPPAVINVIPGGPEQPVLPPIIVPSAPVYKVVLHLTASAKAVPSSDLLKGMLIQVDPKIYPDGSVYPFNGKTIPLPCMVQHSDGKVIDVQPFTKDEEVAAFVKKVMP